MSNTQLAIYIDGHKAEVGDDLSIPITKSFTDAITPTNYKNTYSKQVSIPATYRNNQIFSQIWKFDQILSDQEYYTFNPNKKVDFQLVNGPEVMMEGYVQLTSIKRSNGQPSAYNIILYGYLGDFFQTIHAKELQDLDFEYKLDHVINSTVVSAYSEGNKPELYNYLRYMMAYNGRYENFDSGSARGQDLTKEYDENQRLEYRSYYQRPVLKMSEIIQKIANQSGFTVNLSSQFFNSTNPYWADSWLSMPLYVAGQQTSYGHYNDWQNQIYGPVQLPNMYTNFSTRADFAESNDPFWQWEEDQYIDVSLIKAFSPKLRSQQTLTVHLEVQFSTPIVGRYQLRRRTETTDGVLIDRLGLVDYIKEVNPPFRYSNENIINAGQLGFTIEPDQFTGSVDVPVSYEVNIYPYDVDKIQIFRNVRLAENDESDALIIYNLDTHQEVPGNVRFEWSSSPVSVEYDYEIRSNSYIRQKDIIPLGIPQSSIFIDYCKIFGLLFDINPLTNEIDVVTRQGYFADYKIVDWSDRIDYSKEVSINPLPYNYRYGVLKWKESDTKYEKQYLNRFNQNYGSVLLDTGYEFNVAQHDLMNELIYENAIMSTEFDASFKGRSTIPYRDDKILPALFNAGNGNERLNSGTKLSLFFYVGGLASSNPNYPFQFTDDYYSTETYYDWNGVNPEQRSMYQFFTRVTAFNGEFYSWDFGKPAESYFDITDEQYPESATLYNRFWKRFWEERLNANTRIMTCWAYITKSEFASWKFNIFVRIQDSIWHVNKIIDYDVTGNGLTKCELIRVSDISAYYE